MHISRALQPTKARLKTKRRRLVRAPPEGEARSPGRRPSVVAEDHGVGALHLDRLYSHLGHLRAQEDVPRSEPAFPCPQQEGAETCGGEQRRVSRTRLAVVESQRPQLGEPHELGGAGVGDPAVGDV